MYRAYDSCAFGLNRNKLIFVHIGEPETKGRPSRTDKEKIKRPKGKLTPVRFFLAMSLPSSSHPAESG